MFKKSNEIYLNNHLIIKLVSEHPEIWNKNSKNYRDRNKNDEAWKDISQKLFKDWNNCSDEIKSLLEKMVLRRWSSLRDSYIKWCKKCNDKRQTRGGAIKYLYHRHLAFLEPFVHTASRSSIRKERVKKVKPAQVEVEAEMEAEVDDVQFVGEAAENEFPTYEVPIHVEENHILGTTSTTISNKHDPLKNEDNHRREDNKITSKYIDLLHHMSDRISNRHYMFFQGLFPSLKYFNEDETLRLQANVIQCIKNIKAKRQFDY